MPPGSGFTRGETVAPPLITTVYASMPLVVWMGVRVAEGAGLENRYARKGIVGSNPTPSVLEAGLRFPDAKLQVDRWPSG